MSKITKIQIKNWIGIESLEKDLGNVNKITGPKGSGKSSFVEALEMAFTNKKRRTEVIRHGAEEATIFVKTDEGLEIDRRIRDGKANYMKVEKPGEKVPSTEAYLRKFINGDVFRPLDFVQKSPDEQAKIILDMLDIAWTTEDIATWFGEVPDAINYDMHILKILKAIEAKYYESREAVNREIKVLEIQVKGIKDELPANYDGEYWREQKLEDYYTKISEAEQLNQSIEKARNLITSFEQTVETIKAQAEAKKESEKSKFNLQRADFKEQIQFQQNKIESLQAKIGSVEEETAKGIKAMDDEFANQLVSLKLQHEKKKLEYKETIAKTAEEAKKEVADREQMIAAKEQQLLGIADIEKQTLEGIDTATEERISHGKEKLEESKDVAEQVETDIEPLREEAKNVANMQSYIREWDRMKKIEIEKLIPRKQQSTELTGKIETARELPMKLLKTATVPIQGLEVDSEGKIRIKGKLIDGLSEGEQLELAVKMAMAMCGELKAICVDGINKINPESRKVIDELIEKDYQVFLFETTDGEFNVEVVK